MNHDQRTAFPDMHVIRQSGGNLQEGLAVPLKGNAAAST
jgi:hypothetical protein